MNARGFTHFDTDGRPQMVDVSDKPDSQREAIAEAVVCMSITTRDAIERGRIEKGDVLQVAEIAGIMAAKQTSHLIPLCHTVPINNVIVQARFEQEDDEPFASLRLTSTVKTNYKTGVEMEALTACTVAALTVYDMCKALDREITIRDVRLVRKSGGKSGTLVATDSSL